MQTKENVQLSEHFWLSEFRCKCGQCDDPAISQRLLDGLERLRVLAGNNRITINSGYRCQKHNKTVGGSRNSQHLYGTAADIVVQGVPPDRVAELAEYVPQFAIGGIGKYRTFTHVDVRQGPARWDYR